MSNDKNTTIIIKRIKKGGHGHHGGAWKVAYADFVTAMMAFFLLLWLLTSTPVENLQGLADYFSPTVGMQGKLGIGFKGGKSPNTEGVSTGDWASKGLIFGAPPTGPLIRLPEETDPTDRDNPKVEFTRISQDQLKQAAQTALAGASGVEVTVTPDGLEIRISDNEGRPLFVDGTDTLQPYIEPIIRSIADLAKSLPHYLRITGHTPFNPAEAKTSGQAPFYSDWELSAARANSVRRALVADGLDSEQIAAVVGKADQEPLNQEHPSAPENARVTVTLMEETRTGMHKQSAPPGALFEEDQ